MPKTLKITHLAGSRRDSRGRGGGLLPPKRYEGLKTPANEVSGR